MVLADASDGHAQQFGGAVLGLLAGQDRRRQVDGDEVGEPGTATCTSSSAVRSTSRPVPMDLLARQSRSR